ncbi:exonuclease V a 5' deoxyribonuclease-domain-containing protein, partial [Russula emetica]
RSPFEEFRSQTLSVSDLVGPAWCEVKFDYGLRQGRSLPLADRPDSFVTGDGKEITVNKRVAKVNEKVLGRGRSVHKELEREIFPESVKIETVLKEEYWAAYLVNMLTCLVTLVQLGFTREMPVFGIVQDHPIIGIIDEILLKPIPDPEAAQGHCNKRARTSAPRTPKKSTKQQESSPTQSHLTDFSASPSKAKSRKSASPPRNMVNELSLIDTKTRRSNSLPSDDDAFSSRMQLMLYHHLLSALLSPTFSFSAFWEKVQVDPFVQFSDAFLMQSGLARQTDGNVVLASAECLDDLTDLWHSTVRSLQVQGVSPTLEIVYRTQSKRSAAAPEVSRPTRLNDGLGNVADREARDLALAIEASRREVEDDADLQRALAESLRDVMPEKGSEAEPTDSKNPVADTRCPSRQVTEQLSDKPDIPWSTAELGTGAGKRKEPQPEMPRVIGRKSFAFDEAVLHAYVQDVLQWWRGERPPRGVDLEHTRRCSSCEYRDDCEWREMKAKEAQEMY